MTLLLTVFRHNFVALFQGKDVKPPRSTSSLHDLNDHCLMKIFEERSLDLIDLCSLSQTCRRFQEIVQCIAPKKCDFDQNHMSDYKVKAGNYLHKMFRSAEVEKIFKHLGLMLKCISIRGRSYTAPYLLVDLMARYCDEEFKSLTMSHVRMTAEFTPKLKRTFSRLHTLHLTEVSTDRSFTSFTGMTSLVELRICNVEYCSELLVNNFPKLKRFGYRKQLIISGHLTSHFFPSHTQYLETVTDFLLRHNSLEALDLSFSSDTTCRIEIMEAINAYCDELEELSIDFRSVATAVHLQPLQMLQSLKRLTLSNIQFENFNFFSTLTELLELHLLACRLPKDANEFASLAQVEKLEIKLNADSNINVPRIIEHLPNAKELKVYRSDRQSVVNYETFSKIVKILLGRSHIFTLTSQFNFNINNAHGYYRIRLVQMIDKRASDDSPSRKFDWARQWAKAVSDQYDTDESDEHEEDEFSVDDEYSDDDDDEYSDDDESSTSWYDEYDSEDY